MGLYRAGVNTAGLIASRLYDLTEEDEADERTRALIDGGFLVAEPDMKVHAAGLPDPDAVEPEPSGPYIEPPTVRLGVPAIPT